MRYLFISVLIFQNFFFGMNKSDKTSSPAYFDVTNVVNPITPYEEATFSGTIYITNTGDNLATKNVQVVWRKGSTIMRDTIYKRSLAGSNSVNFTDSYTFEIGDAGINWTISATTPDDSYLSTAFEVYDTPP